METRTERADAPIIGPDEGKPERGQLEHNGQTWTCIGFAEGIDHFNTVVANLREDGYKAVGYHNPNDGMAEAIDVFKRYDTGGRS